MNTYFEYVYIDKSNYKKYQGVVLKGEFSARQLENIRDKLFDGEWFVPHQVGLPEERFYPLNEDDGALFFMLEPEPTDALPNEELNMSCEDLYRNFLSVTSWDLAFGKCADYAT